MCILASIPSKLKRVCGPWIWRSKESAIFSIFYCIFHSKSPYDTQCQMQAWRTPSQYMNTDNLEVPVWPHI